MADYAPVYGRPKSMTLTAGAAITGGQLLVFSAADTVVPSAVNPANYAGVAAHDAASGAPVTVFMGAGIVHETPVAAGVAAGRWSTAARPGSSPAPPAPATGPWRSAWRSARSPAPARRGAPWKSLVG